MTEKVVEIPLTEVEIKEVQVLRLEPGDALIVHVPRPAEMRVLAAIQERLEGWLHRTFSRRVDCLVVEDGARIEILRDRGVPTLEERH